MLKCLFFISLSLFANYSFANAPIQRDSQLQKIFTQGMNAFNKGNYQLASQYFRKILKDNPNLLRPRLELARALYNNGDYRVAKYHFEQVLSVATLPNNVRINIKNFLRLIRRELPVLSWSLDVSFNEKIPKKTTYFMGMPFTYENTDITQDSYLFGAQSKIPINPKQQTFAKLMLQHSEIINNENDNTYLKASIGKHYQLPQSATITPEIGAHYLNYQGKKFYAGGVFGVSYFKPIAKADYVSLTYNYMQLDHITDYEKRDGKQNKISIGYIKLPSISSRLDASLSLSKTGAQDKTKAFKRLGLNVSYNQDIGNAWNIGANFRANRTKYQKSNAWDYGVKKKNKEHTFELSLLNKYWQINNIAPKLILGKTKNSSNIDDYGKSSPYVRLGFTQQF